MREEESLLRQNTTQKTRSSRLLLIRGHANHLLSLRENEAKQEVEVRTSEGSKRREGEIMLFVDGA